MAKTNVPSVISVNGRQFRTNAKPDAYDFRDLEYRPMLRPLPPRLDAGPDGGAFFILNQDGQSCTGHAMAAVINTVLARQAAELKIAAPGLVSPYMLYRLARRYDEFPGQADDGSSLRGAFKGWLRHGVALDAEWQQLALAQRVNQLRAEVDLDNPDFTASCRQRPLGAYYRVNALRLDDMQSAINELHAIAVSAAVHTGWERPVPVTTPDGRRVMVIKRDKPAQPIGGHAFALVGYDELGFLVQNSWGKGWGMGGFAILQYEDWLTSAYDAWVCRPGVPSTPFVQPASASRITTSGEVVLSGGPNLTLLRPYVVNTGNEGRLSTSGKFTSSLVQLDEMFANMSLKHAAWGARDGTTARHIVLYAHGGLIDEFNGLSIAQRQLNWWLNNHVYPINFAWESGAIETIVDALDDVLHGRLPFGGLRFDFEEQWDRLVEGTARRLFAGLWAQMKGNATGASARDSQGDIRGGTEISRRLLDYRTQHGPENVHIHLAGHSAGTIFLTALARRLSEAGIPIDSLAFMGGAVTNALFEQFVLPSFTSGMIKRFTTFNLSEQMEQDDTCPGGDTPVYHKSLLYLVARGLEPDPDRISRMVPLVGLQLGLDAKPGTGSSLGQAIESASDTCDGRIVIAPGGSSPDLRSDARGHGDFDDDRATMTSILLRMLQVPTPPGGAYQPNAAISDLPGPMPVVISGVPIATPAPAAVARPARRRGRPPMMAAAAPAPADRAAEIRVPTEAAIAPRSKSPAFDILQANGYAWDEPPTDGAEGAAQDV